VVNDEKTTEMTVVENAVKAFFDGYNKCCYCLPKHQNHLPQYCSLKYKEPSTIAAEALMTP